MSDKEIKGEMVEMVGVNVVNTAHEGYRRAGFVLSRGENNLPPVTAAVLKALEADPRLAVMVIASDIDSVTSGRLGDQVIPPTIALDETSLAIGDITIKVEDHTSLTPKDTPLPEPEIIVPVETPAPVIDESQPLVTDDLNPVEAPAIVAEDVETKGKGKGKK